MHPEEAELAHLPVEPAREFPGGLQLDHARADLPYSELPHDLAQRDELVGKQVR